jgi:SAM-dependent methyltransferase
MQSSAATFIPKMENHYSNDVMNQKRLTTPGSQYLLRLLRGGYLGDYASRQDLKVLDVGCGSGFDLVTIERLGWQSYGCDISQSIVDYAAENAAKFGCHPELKVGDNQKLPFEGDFFDILLSNNVIHYLDSAETISEAIAEYARVLKPGGRLFLQTGHPENWLLKGAQPLGGHLFRVKNQEDFRDEEVLFVFETREMIEEFFSPHFRDLQIGFNSQEYFTKCLKHWVISALCR